ncbi:hydroxymethylbilane synthase [Inquilinus limosus]|uniref:hydroxymethylbilane synthase n=1 Tax=Inquilinus limosus TaxID=171674 RepID=UPI003F18A8E4
MSTVLRIGTRGSALALAQAEETRRRLIAAHPALAAPGAVEIKVVRTTGDRVQDRPLSEIGGKGLFTKEIEDGLLDGSLDIAVHSMKDVATKLPDGLIIGALLPREDPRDALFARDSALTGPASLAALAPGAVVGTSSLRRQAQLLALRPDLRVVPFRGNVDTRLAKLDAGAADATLLALAGLKRIGRADRVSAVLDPREMLPAVAQGAIGIECRAGDDRVRALLAPLHDRDTGDRVAAERALLTALEGDCRTPIAALAEIGPDDTLTLTARVAVPDGSEMHEDRRSGRRDQAEQLGREAGDALRRRIGPRFRAG